MTTVYIVNRIRFPNSNSPKAEQMSFAIRDYDTMIEQIEADFQAETGDEEDRKQFLDSAFSKLELGESRKVQMGTRNLNQSMGYQVTHVQVF